MKQHKLMIVAVLALVAVTSFAQAQVNVGVTTSVSAGGVVNTVADKQMDDGIDEKKSEGSEGKASIEIEVKDNDEDDDKNEDEDTDEDDLLDEVTLDMDEDDFEVESGAGSTIDSEAMLEMQDADDVHSEADLKLFIRAQANEDKNIKEVQVASGTVKIVYDEPVEFFGVINMTVPTEVSVDAQGNITVEYPWYHIFMKKHFTRSSIQADIASSIAQESTTPVALTATSSTAVNSRVTALAKVDVAEMLEILIKSLKKVRLAGEASIG